MSVKKKGFFLSLLIALFCVWGEARADGPARQIQETIEQVAALAKDAEGRSDEDKRELLRSALAPRFDFFEMAKRALGRHWNNVPDRQREFVAAFAEFLANAYAANIVAHTQDKVAVVRESIDKDHAQVDTQVVPLKGEPFSITYRLHQIEGAWKIYDVVLEQVSLVNNYRSQFNRILASGSFDDLMKLLKQKSGPQGT